MDWKEKHYYVYILASKKHGTLYTGVTNNLAQRVLEHRLKVRKGFAEKYSIGRIHSPDFYRHKEDDAHQVATHFFLVPKHEVFALERPAWERTTQSF